METILDCMWELLRELVINTSIVDNDITTRNTNWIRKAEDAEKSVKIIETFFDNLKNNIAPYNEEISMPLHLQAFKKALEGFHDGSINGVREGALEAKAMSHNCCFCAVCRGCAEKFYEAVANGDSTERVLPVQLENYFLLPAQMHYYQSGLIGSKERRLLNNKLLCLKGFSSSTPTIHSATFSSDCAGGGLYINYQGFGIAVDPGIGFVKSMHKYGVFITDIDLVIITHDHLDHNADAAVLSSLLYDYNRYSHKKDKIIREIFGTEKDETHKIRWIVDESTKNKLYNQVDQLSLLEEYLKEPISVECNNSIKLSAIRTEHIRGNTETYGIKISMGYDEGIVVLGYTSDTGYFPGLSTYLQDVDVLIFNISDIYKKDVKGIKNKHSHLGYNGSLKLLKDSNAKLAIASEFCCTNGDFRANIVKVLKEEISVTDGCDVFPGEIGLSIDLPLLQVECSFCKKKVSANSVKFIAPGKEYDKIQYICGNCI